MQNYDAKYSGLGQGTLCIQQQRVEEFLEEDRIHSQMFDYCSKMFVIIIIIIVMVIQIFKQKYTLQHVMMLFMCVLIKQN